MRITYFVEQFLSPSETFILNQVRWFNKNHEVTVICNDQKGNHHNDIQIKVIPFQKSLKSRISDKFLYLSRYNKSFSQKINTYLNQYKPDVIHCHFGIQALLLLDNLKLDIPVFITFHGYDTKRYLEGSRQYRIRWRTKFKNPKIHPIFVCAFHKNLFSAYGINSQNAKILYNGVYLKWFKRTSFPDDHSFVQVSRLTSKKGHFFTIKAFEAFNKKFPLIPFSLTFIGDGELKNEIQHQIATSPIKNQIHLISWLKRKELIDEIQKHKYYVQHSITTDSGDIEATSISILEAMAMQMPILSSFHAGIPETVEDGKHGILVEEKNIIEFVEGIKKIIRWEYLPSNRIHVEKKFNLELRNNKLDSFYQESFS